MQANFNFLLQKYSLLSVRIRIQNLLELLDPDPYITNTNRLPGHANANKNNH
jgi:hypothetical protein